MFNVGRVFVVGHIGSKTSSLQFEFVVSFDESTCTVYVVGAANVCAG